MRFPLKKPFLFVAILCLYLCQFWGCQTTTVSQRYGKKETEFKGKTIYDRLFKAAYEEKNVDIPKTKEALKQASIASGAREKFKQEINAFMGTKYKFGGSDRNGVDCSGFVLRVYHSALNIKLPHSAAAQSQLGQGVPTSGLVLGDLVFFRAKPRKITHVGIYMGEGQFAHASTSSGVILSRLDESYYQHHYAFSKRLINW